MVFQSSFSGIRIPRVIIQLAAVVLLTAGFGFASLTVDHLHAFAASSTPPLLQLPWPLGKQYNINGGNSYGCGDHTGLDAYAIDFALPSGSQVAAVAAGTAHTVRGTTGYGNYVWILHANNFVSLYGHLKSFKVSNGVHVRQGQVIGISDSTGNSTGPHLHFSLRSNATNQFNGSAYKPEPMSNYIDFGAYGYCTGLVSPKFTSSVPYGNVWITGHDPDYHCTFESLGCNYLKVAITFVMRGSNLPLLALDHGSEVASAINAAFGSSAPTVITIDPRSQFPVSLLNSKGKPLYSAVIIASDVTCGGCDNNNAAGDTPDSNAINSNPLGWLNYINAGGGILALAGAYNISVFYNFLPIQTTAIPVSPSDGSPGGFTLTHAGLSEGLVEGSDDNCCITHNSFDLPGSGSDTTYQVLETDSAGEAETMAF